LVLEHYRCGADAVAVSRHERADTAFAQLCVLITSINKHNTHYPKSEELNSTCDLDRNQGLNSDPSSHGYSTLTVSFRPYLRMSQTSMRV
jgi:hypothetical protein